MSRFINAFIAIIVLSVLLGCEGRPVATIVVSDGLSTVHVETLHDYPTTVTKVQILAKGTKKIVFNAEASEGKPQLRSFQLKPGPNSIDLLNPHSGSYRVTIPADSGYFTLEPGASYTVIVCNHRCTETGLSIAKM